MAGRQQTAAVQELYQDTAHHHTTSDITQYYKAAPQTQIPSAFFPILCKERIKNREYLSELALYLRTTIQELTMRTNKNFMTAAIDINLRH